MQGYVLIAIGERYIDEVANLITTLRKQGDNRPVTVIIDESTVEYFTNKNTGADYTLLRVVDDNFGYYKTEFEMRGMYPKVNLYHFAPYEENIFLDSDVVCQSPTEKVWTFLGNHRQNVVMVGRKNDPTWYWGTIDKVSYTFGKKVPHTHGGFIYFRKPQSEKFYKYASDVVRHHDSYGGLRQFRGGSMADEFVYALTFAEFGYSPVNFDEFPIMTFNIRSDMEIPTKLQTSENKILDDFIPFIHIYDRSIYLDTYNKIMSQN
jgi:hypothetical protein